MKINFKRLDHVQLCVPEGEVENARTFYCEVLGLQEIERPIAVREMAGFWLEIADIRLHIATEPPMTPSRRHPAFEIEHLEAVRAYLLENAVRIKEEVKIDGLNRFSMYDLWNNRIELIEKER